VGTQRVADKAGATAPPRRRRRELGIDTRLQQLSWAQAESRPGMSWVFAEERLGQVPDSTIDLA